MTGIKPENLIFLDESGAKTNMIRRYAWAPKNQRAIDLTSHGHWKTTTMLSAIRLGGVIKEASILTDGPMNSATFIDYITHCLVRTLKPGDVVIMDNLSAHKSTAVREAIEQVGAKLLYLSPYSPDFNPIEQMWSKVKTWLRTLAAKTQDELEIAYVTAINKVTASDIKGWFKGSNYL